MSEHKENEAPCGHAGLSRDRGGSSLWGTSSWQPSGREGWGEDIFLSLKLPFNYFLMYLGCLAAYSESR